MAEKASLSLGRASHPDRIHNSVQDGLALRFVHSRFRHTRCVQVGDFTVFREGEDLKRG
jgi:hypothetical protein